MRCERFEPRALRPRVRNGQEQFFDEFGNLFNVDNDGVPGERVSSIVEGGMTVGACIGNGTAIRTLPRYRGKSLRLDEGRTLSPRFPGQRPSSFRLSPTIPTDLVASPDPGTALSQQFRNFFFLAQGRKMTAFKVRPKGGLRDVRRADHPRRRKHGVAFGPMALSRYGLDERPERSRRNLEDRLDRGQNNPARKRTSQLLAEGMGGKDEAYLVAAWQSPIQRQGGSIRTGQTGKRHGPSSVAKQTKTNWPASTQSGEQAKWRGWPDGKNKNANGRSPASTARGQGCGSPDPSGQGIG